MNKSQNQKFLNPLPDCVTLFIKRDRKNIGFKPKYTHNFFGVKETIFGYQNLTINLSLSPSCSHCFVNYDFDFILKNLSETDCTPYQIQQSIFKHLNEKSICKSVEEFNNICDIEMEGRSNFVPPGECIYEFETKNRKFAIYHCSLKDEKARQYIQNIQHFILWFIDGTKKVPINDPRWHFLLLFEKLPSYKSRKIEKKGKEKEKEKEAIIEIELGKEMKKEKEKEKEKENENEKGIKIEQEQEQEKEKEKEMEIENFTNQKPKDYYFSLLGFLNFYNFNMIGNKQRMRVSHFVMFGPFYDHMIGFKFISQMFKIGLKNNKVFEITAEDPTPRYQLLRTAYHFKKFLNLKEMIKKTSITHKDLSYIKKKLKMPTRQVWICFELINCLNSYIKTDSTIEKKLKDLLIKKRLEGECDDYMIGDLEIRAKKDEGGYKIVFDLVFQLSKEKQQKNK
ncbi:histone acetyltransferase type b catalytic subunit [Anaeramoeba flamelloides]|uniref:histone acetyltransferase n=1 Tax=Anaeramoeba flamelloides TaxID=1746091 RepID=A0AAV7Z3G5_9EUKA|nr:histone acetyltransferase type b catalytic subunit [Anaeramoeba flamelloides]